LKIAQGSLKECVVCLSIAKSQEYISSEENKKYREQLEELSKMISGLLKYLKNNN